MSPESARLRDQWVLAWHLDRVHRRLAELMAPAPQGESPAPAPVDSGGSALESVVGRFHLTEFERDVLLLAAGARLHAGIQRVCAQATGRPAASLDLAIRAFADASWDALSPLATLRSSGLVVLDADGAVHLPERVFLALLGVPAVGSGLAGWATLVQPSDEIPRLFGASVAALAEFLRSDAGGIVVLCGAECQAAIRLAATASARTARPLLLMDGSDVPRAPADREELALAWRREAGLSGAVLLVDVDDLDEGGRRSCARFVEALPGAVVLIARHGLAELRCDAYRLDLPRVSSEAMGEQARVSARARLEALAQRVRPEAGWADLVLPRAQREILREVAAQVRNQGQVVEAWGFGRRDQRGLGVTALFHGPSGTGKTMAAEVLAGELRLDLFRIDLSQVVSKYIGETEKNLRRIFDAAEGARAVLLFDEADALFGKRSDVRDSHDRYANIEVSYLLQRMEAYAGLAILTTNLHQAMDPAFLRRIRFFVPFPFPDAAQRQDIWRAVLPPELPIEGLAFEELGMLDLTGGNIRNVALNAAFLAAEDRGALRMRHIARAARTELAKLGRPVPEPLLGRWA